MPAGALKTHHIAVDVVNQQLVWLDMQIPESLPVPFQRMVEIASRKRKLLDEKPHRLFELFHILPALPGQLYIPLELAGIGWKSH
jgi:hypothetical protein